MAKSSGGGELITLGLIGIGAYIFWPTISSWFGLTSSAAATTTSTTGTGTSTTGTSTSSTSSSTAQPSQQLDQAYTAMVAAATASAAGCVSNGSYANCPNSLSVVNGNPQTTWSAWNYFLAQVASSLAGKLPGYQTVTGNQDLNLPMTAAVYWGYMGPWLAANQPGLSGLGMLAGLGLIARRHGLGHFGRR